MLRLNLNGRMLQLVQKMPLPSRESCCEEQEQRCGMELPPCPGIEQQDGRRDRQTDKQAPNPALPLRAELSSPARGGKLSADPNIAAAAARRSQNICVARQHEPAGLLLLSRCRNSTTPEPPARQRRSSPAPAERWQWAGTCRGEGSMSPLPRATQASMPCPETLRAP